MDIFQLFIFILAGSTSAVVFLLAVKKLRLRTSDLRIVIRDLSECVGAVVLFFLLNVGLGITATFLLRSFWGFFPLYSVTDMMLLAMSAMQGFVFQMWWRRSRG